MNAFTVSDNGRYLAYSTDNTGFRQYTLYVKDLQTRADAARAAAEDRTPSPGRPTTRLSFTRCEDLAKRSYRLYRHVLGTDVAQDAVVYEEKDEKLDCRHQAVHAAANISSWS